MESLWKKTVELPRQRVLGQDLQVQCAIVGGGMAGLLTALFLERNGVEAVRRTGWQAARLATPRPKSPPSTA